MTSVARAAILLLAFAACAAEAQQTGHFKGKVKPGLYETTLEFGTPVVGKEKLVDKECVTSDHLATWEPDKGCTLRDFKASDTKATFTSVCGGREPQSSDVTVSVGAESFSIEKKVTVSEREGKTSRQVQRLTGRYLGPCNP